MKRNISNLINNKKKTVYKKREKTEGKMIEMVIGCKMMARYVQTNKMIFFFSILE
jgi:hypothetical protein